MKLPHALMNPRWIMRAEWTLAVLLLVTIFALLVVRAMTAGALWRDQCGTAQLALMPLGELLQKFDHQTLPPLLPLLYRLHLKLFGTANPSVQAFRFTAVVGLVVAAFISARMNGKQAPLLLLALLGLNSVLLYWGGYALIAISIAVVLTLAAGLLLQPSSARAVGLAIAALISVQLLINNLLLVTVLTVAAIVACLVRASYKWALVFASILIVCVLSDLVYLSIYAGADWRILLKVPMTFGGLWPAIRSAFGKPRSLMLCLWYFVFAATLIAALWRLIIAWRRDDAPRCRLSIFAILIVLLVPTAYCISFVLSGVVAESRHFLPMVAILAANFDVVIAHLANHSWIRLGRIALTVTALLVMPFASWQTLTKRQTNIDIVAHRLEQEAGPNDLIIVNPWSFGISFNWYYHGVARWLTLPNISDHRIHRYDLIKEKMMSSSPLEDVKRETIAALRRGNRVWVVGSLYRQDPPGIPLFPFPAPDPEFGWQHMIYRDAWTRQLRDFVARRATKVTCLMKPLPHVSTLENVPLWVVEGERQ